MCAFCIPCASPGPSRPAVLPRTPATRLPRASTALFPSCRKGSDPVGRGPSTALTPLECAVPRFSDVSPLECADPKTPRRNPFRMRTYKKTGEGVSSVVLLLTFKCGSCIPRASPGPSNVATFKCAFCIPHASSGRSSPTLLPLCFQSLPRCSSRNPFLFMLLHCCRGWLYPIGVPE